MLLKKFSDKFFKIFHHFLNILSQKLQIQTYFQIYISIIPSNLHFRFLLQFYFHFIKLFFWILFFSSIIFFTAAHYQLWKSFFFVPRLTIGDILKRHRETGFFWIGKEFWKTQKDFFSRWQKLSSIAAKTVGSYDRKRGQPQDQRFHCETSYKWTRFVWL